MGVLLVRGGGVEEVLDLLIIRRKKSQAGMTLRGTSESNSYAVAYKIVETKRKRSADASGYSRLAW